MAKIIEWIKMDENQVVEGLREAGEKLRTADGEVILDFSSVSRIDPSSLRAMEDLADIADDKGIKVVLSGVKVDVYKVLRLVKATPRFSFVASPGITSGR